MQVNFHLALSGISKIISSLCPILRVSKVMKNVFGENPIISLRRPRNKRDELVGSKLNNDRDEVEGMKKCGKSRCKIYTFVEKGWEFESWEIIKNIWLIFPFNCDLEGYIYLISCQKCWKNYVVSRAISFRKRFNHKKQYDKVWKRADRDSRGTFI